MYHAATHSRRRAPPLLPRILFTALQLQRILIIALLLPAALQLLAALLLTAALQLPAAVLLSAAVLLTAALLLPAAVLLPAALLLTAALPLQHTHTAALLLRAAPVPQPLLAALHEATTAVRRARRR